jgi:hypothetical protein
MPTYGMFTGSSQVAAQTVEGEYMVQNGEYVMIFRKSKRPGVTTDDQVAAFRLDKNQVIREID